MRLQGLTAIVTGAGKGIGRGIAHVFAREGARVLVATVEEEGIAVQEEIRMSGGEALFVQTDVSSESSVAVMVDQVIRHWGRVDVLVNNAGITLFKSLLETTLEDWDRVMNVDLRGVFLCCKTVAPHMIRQGRGSIINISSVHSMATLPETEIYAAAKGGVNGLTRSMALSLGPRGIRVNAICPGFTDTPHYRRWMQQKPEPEAVDEEVLSLHPSGRIVTPEDIGALATYLASDESRMMTGAILPLDGGLTARLYNAKLC